MLIFSLTASALGTVLGEVVAGTMAGLGAVATIESAKRKIQR